MCLALRASGLWLRYATLQNLLRDQMLPSGNLESKTSAKRERASLENFAHRGRILILEPIIRKRGACGKLGEISSSRDGMGAGMITAVTKSRNDIEEEEEDLGGEEGRGVMLCEWQSRVLSQSSHVALYNQMR